MGFRDLEVTAIWQEHDGGGYQTGAGESKQRNGGRVQTTLCTGRWQSEQTGGLMRPTGNRQLGIYMSPLCLVL